MPGGHVCPESDVDFIKHGVIEIMLVRSDARLLKRIDAKCDDKAFLAGFLINERVDVRSVGRRVEHNQGRVLVTGGEGRRDHTCGQQDNSSELQDGSLFFHGLCPFIYLFVLLPAISRRFR